MFIWQVDTIWKHRLNVDEHAEMHTERRIIMKKWSQPKVQVMKQEDLSKIVKRTLSIESSLYASGCHHGMIGCK